MMLRIRSPELMDDPRLHATEHVHALRALNRINRVLGADRQLAAGINDLAGCDFNSVLDLGAGGCGFLGFLAGKDVAHIERRYIALDVSQRALRYAGQWHTESIHCVRADAHRVPFADDSIDIVTSSLFLHHFSDEGVTSILREASRVARKGIVIGDLTRSRVAWITTWLATHATSRSRVFHVDGPRSVRAAFRPAELQSLTEHAGLRNATVARRFPFRMMLVWKKEA